MDCEEPVASSVRFLGGPRQAELLHHRVNRRGSETSSCQGGGGSAAGGVGGCRLMTAAVVRYCQATTKVPRSLVDLLTHPDHPGELSPSTNRRHSRHRNRYGQLTRPPTEDLP